MKLAFNRQGGSDGATLFCCLMGSAISSLYADWSALETLSQEIYESVPPTLTIVFQILYLASHPQLHGSSKQLFFFFFFESHFDWRAEEQISRKLNQSVSIMLFWTAQYLNLSAWFFKNVCSDSERQRLDLHQNILRLRVTRLRFTTRISHYHARPLYIN